MPELVLMMLANSGLALAGEALSLNRVRRWRAAPEDQAARTLNDSMAVASSLKHSASSRYARYLA